RARSKGVFKKTLLIRYLLVTNNTVSLCNGDKCWVRVKIRLIFLMDFSSLIITLRFSENRRKNSSALDNAPATIKNTSCQLKFDKCSISRRIIISDEFSTIYWDVKNSCKLKCEKECI